MGYEGANVIIIDIKEDLANAVAEEISKQGGTALAFQSDVRDSAKIYHIVDETVNRYGGVDILINNAEVLLDGIIRKNIGGLLIQQRRLGE